MYLKKIYIYYFMFVCYIFINEYGNRLSYFLMNWILFRLILV